MFICRRAPSISHLLFVDDSLFCRASQEEVHVVKEILQLYAMASGQCINFEKSSIYFSSKAGHDQKEWIKNNSLVTLALILLLTTATVERVFSTMNIIKNRLRNQIGDQWINDCLVTYIEKDIFKTIKCEEIMQRFQNMKNR